MQDNATTKVVNRMWKLEGRIKETCNYIKEYKIKKLRNYWETESLYIYIIYIHECNMFQSPGYALENKQITWKHAKLTNKDFFWILKYFNFKKHYITENWSQLDRPTSSPFSIIVSSVSKFKVRN